ncbi:N-acetylmuramic acid 6-phosphate etherase [Paenibacillus montanisoli]|uniref:N-acetylmuramic acid 6-phosphate etherase n=1 Tax=Paenibacillus montanisoli TaxID=2081970 RepID=UPI001F0B7C88|nr:N-acetylmuramic acid 6-phosphate etherase [Paenibacillus montanisoli]
MSNPIESLNTEQRNPRSDDLDVLSSLEIVQCMNMEDRLVAPAVGECLNVIAEAIDTIARRMESGGRLIYVGAGTSGKLGALDAYEFPPTFGVDPSLVKSLTAGEGISGHRSPEEAEDDESLGETDLQLLQVDANDAVVGIAASGSTPYVVGALRYARSIGCATVSLACNSNSVIGRIAAIAIEVVVGPEVLAGSTRLKAGTAQKMVLNMISTGVMSLQGKVYRNYMVNLVPSNEKLRKRARAIIQQLTGADKDAAAKVYEQSGNDISTSVVMLTAGVTAEAAAEYLRQGKGRIREALRLAGAAG